MKMRWLSMFAMMMVVTSVAMAQEETLISGTLESGGFGGPVVKFSQVKNEFAVFVGGYGGWLINHSLLIGGGGYGLVNDIEVKEIVADQKTYLNLGYGGFMLEYFTSPQKLFHFSFQTLIGAGGVSYRDRDGGQVYANGNDDGFFVAEPAVNVVLNVTHGFRIGLGASYRYINGVDLPEYKGSDLSGATVHASFMFGKF